MRKPEFAIDSAEDTFDLGFCQLSNQGERKMKKSPTILRRLFTAVGLCAGALAFASAGQAQTATNDVKVIPGAMCSPLASGTTGLNTVFLTALRNTSGAARTVTCPLVRDVHASTFGLFDLDVVTSTGGSGSGVNVISCTAVSVSSQNGLLRSVIGNSPAGGGVIDFGALLLFSSENSLGTAGSRGSTYVVQCNLNNLDVIQAIRYEEI
jgi:hypothetical protein